jgi:site-specific recombinase XerD
MAQTHLIGPWIRRFLVEHLVRERNLARNTQASYRDTLVLLLPFVSQELKQPLDQLAIDQLSPDVVQRFLGHLEQQRGCSVATRNQRLSAIHALARFIAVHSPEHIAWCGEMRAIPFKKTSKPHLAYLDKPEMDALLAAPNRHTTQGRRDYALLLFLYNTGARASEAAQVTVSALELQRAPSVRLLGKGNRIRYCPLWTATVQALTPLLVHRTDSDPVFLNRRQQPITRFGIHALLQRTVAVASQQVPSLRTKSISPHTVRHTTAVHLLRAGVDINTIRAWLGHVSLDTTHIYAEVDLDMKAKALARCEVPSEVTPTSTADWHKNPDLMAFLKGL